MRRVVSAETVLRLHKQGCESCKHWRPSGDGQGECHRNPPTVHMAQDENGDPYTISAWPSTDDDDLCGEWMSAN